MRRWTAIQDGMTDGISRLDDGCWWQRDAAGGTYAQHRPLALSATITFEQSYSEVDGDSAEQEADGGAVRIPGRRPE